MRDILKKLVLLAVVCFTLNTGMAQGPQEIQTLSAPTVDPAPLAATITAEDLRQHLMVIASDEFEGRETGEPGNEKAAAYIADHFKQLGLPPVVDGQYFQPVKFSWTKWEKETGILINQQKFKHLWDFIAFDERNPALTELTTDEVVFLGYGIDDPEYSDYKGRKVKDKVLMIYQGEPFTKNGKSQLTGTGTASDWTNNWQRKLDVAKAKGAKAVLFIEDDIKSIVAGNFRSFIEARMVLDESETGPTYLPNAYISTKMMEAIAGKRFKKVIKARKRMQKKGKSRAVKLKTDLSLKLIKNEKILEGVNVLGYIEGTDPQLKDELVILTAHYDHLGKRGKDIFNGADDNGSGTSTILEVAEAFAKAKADGQGPRRSVLCMLVTGEEKGLLGSEFYTANPVFPLNKTVANVNVDMVGRVDEKYADNPNYIYVIGSDRLSTELHEINETANSTYTNLVLDYTYNAEDDPNRYYYRSDHYNFAEKGIPAIFYFNGTHTDYHRPSDTVEKINFEKMAIIGQLVFHTAWELANRNQRIKVDVVGKN